MPTEQTLLVSYLFVYNMLIKQLISHNKPCEEEPIKYLLYNKRPRLHSLFTRQFINLMESLILVKHLNGTYHYEGIYSSCVHIGSMSIGV